MGCCGGRSPKGATRPLHGGVPRAQPVAMAAAASSDLVKMIYVGTRQGDFRLAAQPTRQQYYVPGQGQFVEIDETGVQGVRPPDLAFFRSVNQGRDFKIVDAPVAPSRVPQPAPEPAPAPVKTAPVDSEAWTPEVMETAKLATISITDAAQDLAEEHGVDWTRLQGSGKDGNILVGDVRQAID